LVRLSKIAIKFADQLLEMHQSGNYHILDLFYTYIGFILKYGGHAGRKDLRLIEKWQLEDMTMCIWNEKIDYTRETLETALNKSRRSGKTEGATLLAVFFALLNYEVKWRSAYMKQQKEAKIWLSLNPFVDRINNQDNLVYLRGSSYYPIDIAVLSPGNVTGVECDVAMFDEGGWVFKNLQLYDAYRNSRPMVAPSNFKHIIHFSTPARYSAFQEAWAYLKNREERLQTQLTVLRTWKDCPWITEEFIEEERQANLDCPWYIGQNYEGEWVVYGGAVFSNFYDVNDSINVSDELYDMFREARPTHGGVDWNGEFTKHFLVLGKPMDNIIFILDEIKFLNIEYLKNFDYRFLSIEVEDEDPFSMPYANECKALGLKVNYFGWNDTMKMERVRYIQTRKTIIDKAKCPTVWKNFQEAALDPKHRNPMLEKRPDQHGLDGALHMCHAGEGILTVPAHIKQRLQQRSGWGDAGKYAPMY
jgi:hypothetical protein